MAWLEQHPTSKHYTICFRFGKRKVKKSTKTVDRGVAEADLKRLEENLRLLERGRLELPPDADIGTFLLSDGKLSAKPVLASPPKAVTFEELREEYLAVHSNGAMETNSLATVRLHLNHIAESIGTSFPIETLKPSHLQDHIVRRSRKRYRGRPLSPTTIRKELASLRACWNWAVLVGKIHGVFPGGGLSYPKTDEKTPFQTREEIEKRIARGGLSVPEVRHLWDSLFLLREEIEEFLDYCRANSTQPFFYPMVCLAAHTGARRSELLRILVDDLDFESSTLLLREKKRERGRRTSRRVPLSNFVQGVLRDWLAIHPGGQSMFCQWEVSHSKSKRTLPMPVTPDEAHDHFKRTVCGSKWAVLRGWHTLRHSFASNAAAAGIDQRIIDSWMGHQTEEMVKRYRHLVPNQHRKAIDSVFS